MKIMGSDYDVRIKRDGSMESNVLTDSFGKWAVVSITDPNYYVIKTALDEFKESGVTDLEKLEKICMWKGTAKHRTRRTKAEMLGGISKAVATVSTETATTVSETVVKATKETLKKAFANLQKFFAEFEFEPSIRLFNTFLWQGTKALKRSYLVSYFELMDNSNVDKLKDKLKSPEFESILDMVETLDLIGVAMKHTNNRLKIYYGAQGTGKTYSASIGSKAVLPCHSGITPDDLMRKFDFDKGTPTFMKSTFLESIIGGGKIVLDEMNLLPLETLRFLQSITDGKEEFEYMGEVITINPEFEIVGTMNLVVNGMPFPLPEPLIDRCSEIRHFRCDPTLVVDAMF